jgi:hypothetical protein
MARRVKSNQAAREQAKGKERVHKMTWRFPQVDHTDPIQAVALYLHDGTLRIQTHVNKVLLGNLLLVGLLLFLDFQWEPFDHEAVNG